MNYVVAFSNTLKYFTTGVVGTPPWDTRHLPTMNYNFINLTCLRCVGKITLLSTSKLAPGFTGLGQHRNQPDVKRVALKLFDVRNWVLVGYRGQ